MPVLPEPKLPIKYAHPWGDEILYAFTPVYAARLLAIKDGHRTSEHYHNRKHETLLVIKGQCKITLNGSEIVLDPWHFQNIAAQQRHRLEGVGDVILVEVSTPELDDTVRVKDDYGRIPLMENGLLG